MYPSYIYMYINICVCIYGRKNFKVGLLAKEEAGGIWVVTRIPSDVLPDHFGVMLSSLSSQAYLSGFARPPQKHDFKTHIWALLGHLVSKLVFSEVVVSRARNDTFAEKVSFGPHGMPICRGALQARNQKSKKKCVLPARDEFFFQPAKLRIGGQIEAWPGLARPSVSQFF